MTLVYLKAARWKIDLVTVSFSIWKPIKDRTFGSNFFENIRLKFIPTTGLLMTMLQAITYIVRNWFVQKIFIGWDVKSTACITVLSLLSTVLLSVCGLWSCLELQKSNRMGFSVLVADMFCVQRVFRAHPRHVSISLLE